MSGATPESIKSAKAMRAAYHRLALAGLAEIVCAVEAREYLAVEPMLESLVDTVAEAARWRDEVLVRKLVLEGSDEFDAAMRATDVGA